MVLTELTLTQAVAAVRSGRVTAHDLVAASLARIDELDGRLRAFAELGREQAMTAADWLDQRPPIGPLHGIPIAIKDNIDTAAMVTACGSAARAGRRPERNATVVDRLLQAGAVIVGKATTHEFAFGGICPPTVNYVDRERIAGGSSGGSAVAVAAGMVHGALGTDTGGSIRIPAAYNGVTALKPTYGRVPVEGVTPLSWSLDHVGPMARTVDDVALLFAVLAGLDPQDDPDQDHPDQDDPGRDDAADGPLKPPPDLRGVRLAAPTGYFREQVDPQILAAADAAAHALAELGATVISAEVKGLETAAAVYRTIVSAEAATYHEVELREHRELYGDAVRDRLDAGQLISAREYIRAQRRRSELTDSFRHTFTDRDLDGILVVTQPMVAPLHGEKTVRFAGGPPLDLLQCQLHHGMPFNLAGLPVLTVPYGHGAGGLPIGLSIAARHHDEETAFRIGRAIEYVSP